MHKIHHTDGFIVESVPSGEANRFLWVYTKDFGLVGAHAQGVRLMKSKLRYTLYDMAYCSLSLVRGRDIWRVTSATRLKEPIVGIIQYGNKRLAFSRILKLVRRLINGEEKDEYLFSVLHKAYVLFQNDNTDERLIKNVEILTVIQILHILGYLSVPTKYLKFIESDPWSMETLRDIGERENEIVSLINQSLESIDL